MNNRDTFRPGEELEILKHLGQVLEQVGAELLKANNLAFPQDVAGSAPHLEFGDYEIRVAKDKIITIAGDRWINEFYIWRRHEGDEPEFQTHLHGSISACRWLLTEQFGNDIHQFFGEHIEELAA